MELRGATLAQFPRAATHAAGKYIMAKEHRRSNREIKKPKAVKSAPAAPASPFGPKTPSAATTPTKRK